MVHTGVGSTRDNWATMINANLGQSSTQADGALGHRGRFGPFWVIFGPFDKHGLVFAGRAAAGLVGTLPLGQGWCSKQTVSPELPEAPEHPTQQNNGSVGGHPSQAAP